MTSVTHQYGGAGHVMSLEIAALDEPRAAAAGKSSAEAVKAASADSVKVWGLPDLGGGASGGTTVKALFTAYYPAANALEGGFLDAQGNKLDPSKKTCAAPPSVAFGTKVTVQGTGTSLDGETYKPLQTDQVSRRSTDLPVPPSFSKPLSETKALTPDRVKELKQNEDIIQLLYIAEQYLGKTLTPTETRKILFFYDELHMSVDLIDYLIEYCVSWPAYGG